MPTVYLAPTFGVGYQAFTEGGEPLNAGLIYTYDAGTTTPQTTYTTSAGSVANANPIVLGADGRPPNEIWLVTQQVYKFVLADSDDNVIATYDNISGINDTSSIADAQFQTTGLTPTYLSATSFSLVGDRTADFQSGRRSEFTVDAGTVYGTIDTSVYTTVTTVTMTMDTGQVLDSGLSVVNLSILTPDPLALPYVGEASVASASTTSLGRVPSTNVYITGSTGISSFGSAAAGITRICRMQGAVTLTYNATSLILPGSASITTAAGDTFEAESLGSGNWVVRFYTRKGTGSTAPLLAGTGANNLVQLDGSGNLPAIDGSAITNLNASNLSSGLVPTARLGTGSASSSTYLRGDQTWAAISSATSVFSSQDAANSATIQFTGLQAGYSYQFVISNLIPQTGNKNLLLQVGTGSGPSWDTGSSYASTLAGSVGGPTTYMQLVTDIGTDQAYNANEGVSGILNVINVSASKFKTFIFQGTNSQTGDPALYGVSTFGMYVSTTAITAIRFYMSSGNITSGNFICYEIARS